ncbi:uncharacterized protein LOC119989520 isoform X2 [Tripterygium wilfordii]|uniref:uncharacterized protein LOC119989520 isoform X2 n=1 Tax=Tripterygium wilfordii TaxID=458696 RepID=UPI0018F81961|nr:uncharacterized protein LOC119989520 isoform X2 [Tripterygium wilfordii]
MSLPAQTEVANNNLGKRASKNRNSNSRRRASLKWRGLEMAIKRTRSRRASSKSLSIEEINANLNLFEAEMAERKPQRGSSEKILADFQRLERDVADLRGRKRSEAEHQKKTFKALEEEEKDIARKRAINRGLILLWSRCTWFLLLSVVLLSVIGFKTSDRGRDSFFRPVEDIPPVWYKGSQSGSVD